MSTATADPKPPAVAMKEQLDEIKALLVAALERQQPSQDGAPQSMDEAKTLTAAIQTTCDTLLRRLDEPVVPGLQGSLDEILQVVRADRQPARPGWRRLAGLGGALALLSGLGGWYVEHTPRLTRQQARLMQHINAVLLERQSTLPADLKAKLGAVYTQQGFPTLEQQGGKR